MKRKYSFLVVVILMVSLIVSLFPTMAGAASTSLLSGKIVKTGSSAVNFHGTTDRVTDGNLETGFTLKPGVSNLDITDTLYYAFASDQIIDSFKIKITNYANQMFAIGFLDASGTVFYGPSINNWPNEDGVYRLPKRLTNVRAVMLYNQHTASLTVQEWDLYRDEIPDTPLNLVASGGNQSVTLTWEEVSNATSYTLKRSESPGGPYEVITENLTSTMYTDTSVTNGGTYYYVVIAKNNEGESIESNEASATPQGNVNPDPTGRTILTLYISGGQIKEYDLSVAELSVFLNWYDAKDAGSGPAKYAFTKSWNKGPYKTRTEYVIFDKILMFDVDEYEVTNP